MKKLILILSLVVFTSAFLCADVYIKTKTHTDAVEMMGQKTPAKDTFTEQWICKDKFAQNMGNMSTILDLGKKKVFIVMHGTKTYLEASLPLDMSKFMPEQMAEMMENRKINVTINPSGQTKKIRKWNCNGYDVVMDIQFMMPITMKMKIWATKDVPFDWKVFVDKMYPVYMKATYLQMPFGDEIVKEFQKIKGFQVATGISMNMMGTEIKMNSQVLEITNKAAPAGTYSVPAGYKIIQKSDFLIPTPTPTPTPDFSYSHNTQIDQELKRAWDQLQEGVVIYNEKLKMNQGIPEKLTVRITRDFKFEMTEDFKDEPIIERLMTSGTMRAELKADEDEFKIDALSSERQPLLGEKTNWIWRVTPLKSGILTINLRVSAVIRLSNSTEETKDVLVKSTRITVEVNRGWVIKQFWGNNWKWILSCPLLLCILGWIISKLKKKRAQGKKIGF